METTLAIALRPLRRAFSLPVSRHRMARSEVGYRRKNLGEVSCRLLLRFRSLLAPSDLSPDDSESPPADDLDDPEPPINIK
jgi:hypothetical protein